MPKPKPKAKRKPFGAKQTRFGRRYAPRRKICFFCTNKNESINYKDPGKLRTYVSDRGKIEPRRRTGTCSRHQRRLSVAIKRARHLALLPYVSEHIRGMRAALSESW